MILEAAGVESVRLPARSPNLNAIAERFVRSIKESCLDRMVLIGESSLHRATSPFVVHYHQERNHQGLENKIIRPEFTPFPTEGAVPCRKRLGGLLRYYFTAKPRENPNVRELPDTTGNKHYNAAGTRTCITCTCPLDYQARLSEDYRAAVAGW
jgi:hypothetical protein